MLISVSKSKSVSTVSRWNVVVFFGALTANVISFFTDNGLLLLIDRSKASHLTVVSLTFLVCKIKREQ